MEKFKMIDISSYQEPRQIDYDLLAKNIDGADLGRPVQRCKVAV